MTFDNHVITLSTLRPNYLWKSWNLDKNAEPKVNIAPIVGTWKCHGLVQIVVRLVEVLLILGLYTPPELGLVSLALANPRPGQGYPR